MTYLRTNPTITRALVLSLALSVIPLAACSNDSSSPPVATTTTSASNKSFEFSTQDGQVSMSLDGKLPPGWPSSFPLPKGATAAGSGSIGGTSATGMVGVFTSSQSTNEVYSFYTGDAGLQVESKSSLGSGDTYVGTVAFGGSPSGRVTVIPKGGQTLIIVTLKTTGTSGSTPATASA